MPLPKISICIPTFEGAPYLNHLLSTLSTEKNISEIEIVISDNASPDNTEEVVNNYRIKLPNLKYIKNITNIGFRKNLFNSIQHATGEYIWLLGDDDSPTTGALSFIIEILNKLNPVLLLPQRISCDALLNPYIREGSCVIEGRTAVPLPSSHLSCYSFSDRKESIAYLHGNTSAGHMGIFVFISTLIFRKSLWQKHNFNYPKISFDIYPHVIKIFEGLLIHGGLVVTTGLAAVNARNWALRPYVASTSDSIINQSQQAETNFDAFRHYHRDLSCFTEIAKYLFPNDKAYGQAFLSSARSLLQLGNNKHIYLSIAKDRGIFDEAKDVVDHIFDS